MSNNFKEIIDRVFLISGIKNQTALAKQLGISSPAISDAKKRGAFPNEWLMELSQLYSLNPAWLLNGKGPVTLEVESLEKGMTIERRIEIFRLDPEVIDIVDGKIPVVKTYDDEDVHLNFFCIHCNRWHHHGRGGKDYPYLEGRGGMAGHRVAHCVAKNSPFQDVGYILDIVGKYKGVKRKHKEGTAHLCPKCRNYYSAAFNACGCGYVNNNRESEYPHIATLYQSPTLPDQRQEYDEAVATIEKRKMLHPEKQIAAPLTEEENAKVTQGEVITRKVLTSKTKFSKALWENLKAFESAVDTEEEMKGMKEEMAEMKALMREIRDNQLLAAGLGEKKENHS
jgi:hypothetical protein